MDYREAQNKSIERRCSCGIHGSVFYCSLLTSDDFNRVFQDINRDSSSLNLSVTSSNSNIIMGTYCSNQCFKLESCDRNYRCWKCLSSLKDNFENHIVTTSYKKGESPFQNIVIHAVYLPVCSEMCHISLREELRDKLLIICSNCGKEDISVICIKCRAFRYCCEKCMKEHKTIHKLVCLEPQLPSVSYNTWNNVSVFEDFYQLLAFQILIRHGDYKTLTQNKW